jgi:multiple sugar transport system substrate-binding protein
MFPHLVFVNKTLFEKYNMPLPSYDYTVDDFFRIAEQITHPEEFYFGTSNPLYEDLFPGWYNGGQGKWGWDGEDYHFDQVWADAINKKYELIDSQVLEWAPPEDKLKFLGDEGAWPPGWGRSAMHIDWPWTISYFEESVTVQSGCEFLYYPLPQGKSGEQLVIVDNVVIGASTKHPREAWELMKMTTWGKEANLVRQKAYRDAGVKASRMPVTQNREVWSDLIDNAPDDNFKALYTRLMNDSMIPSNWPVSPAWGDIERWINEQDIYGRIDRRELNPADVMNELNAKAKELKEEWLANMPR